MSCVDSKESAALQQFQKVAQDLCQDDGTLLRFLRARDGDVRRADDMLRKSLEWRKTHNVSSYVKWRPNKLIEEDFKFDCFGHDKDGYAVIWIPVGAWCVRDMVEKGLKADAFLFRFHILETMIEHQRKSGRDQFVVIIDSAEMTYRKVAHIETIQVILACFRDFEANYPERLKAAYVINTPWVFSYIYAFVKPLLSGRTLGKVKIFDTDAKKWKPALLEQMPEEAMPPSYKLL